MAMHGIIRDIWTIRNMPLLKNMRERTNWVFGLYQTLYHHGTGDMLKRKMVLFTINDAVINSLI
jgi:hypothetical protein